MLSTPLELLSLYDKHYNVHTWKSIISKFSPAPQKKLQLTSQKLTNQNCHRHAYAYHWKWIIQHIQKQSHRKHENTSKNRERKAGIPYVFGESIFDEFFVLEFVKTHEDGVVSGFWSGFEVEHHLRSLWLLPCFPWSPRRRLFRPLSLGFAFRKRRDDDLIVFVILSIKFQWIKPAFHGLLHM